MTGKIKEIVTIPERKGIKIECNCGREWIYTGKNERYCSCPKCRTTITIEKKNKKNSLHADVQIGASTQHVMRIEKHLDEGVSYKYV